MRSSRYETTVAGQLGPVLRSALRSECASVSESSTVVRIHVDDRDLPDLVGRLESLGMELVSVRAVD